MKFEPTNRHILVSIMQDDSEENKSLIYLPEDYKKAEARYALCSVSAVSGDSKFFNSLKKADTVVVDRTMIQKIEVKGNEFYLILENYILGRINKWKK